MLILLNIFQSKLEGTVWEELDDTRLYKEIDLRDFDKTFSAYQKQQVKFYSLLHNF